MINSPSRWWCQSVALAALSLWCGGMDAAEPKAALPNDPAQAWAMITASEKAVQAPLPKPERLMTPAEIQASHDRARAQCSDLAAQAKEFLRRFPDDPRAGEARKVVIRSLSTISAGDHAREEELGAFIASVAANPAVPEDERVEMRLMQIRARAIRLIPAKGRAAADLEFALGFQELIREFPKSEKAFRNALGFARSRTGQDATNLARAISISDSTPGEIKQYARDYLAGKRPFEVGKPLDLKFTATDGSTVDLAALKGKVVLVDFWATWCAPCIEDLPRLKAAYAKFHDRGLEVLGI
ncbi:MAG TPA: TlpA disulfide reductase family protein, partial [Verrucomicrobiae bacterium]|nr:TlpA disulfide reductase family protein [Verrucomicrobiae bacterium]